MADQAFLREFVQASEHLLRRSIAQADSGQLTSQHAAKQEVGEVGNEVQGLETALLGKTGQVRTMTDVDLACDGEDETIDVGRSRGGDVHRANATHLFAMSRSLGGSKIG